ncbi:hypothetical protein CYLTODRAFT_490321 [Cylindrobasidium torrendii FP15055 ss-10]|uniref:Uncharacterized protein n=1 Tax=Cylindrobasidium torrendii FP15055 ss-10 TaxID=1314674 RepID=A0A0D7BBD6_9AGAR|nr:hypothetical protein CYLTODRAFT_490321 [Cylindrobasidium torrendii FP15055 ss-10]
MSTLATTNNAADRLCYIYSIPIDGRDDIASRTVIRNAYHSKLTLHDYSPTATLYNALLKGDCQSDISNARSEQALLQLGDALDRVAIEPGSKVTVFCDSTRLHIEDVLKPILEGKCDLKLLATYFDPKATIGLCWVACRLIDLHQQDMAIEFAPLSDTHRLRFAGLDEAPLQHTPDYDRGVVPLLDRITQLYGKAMTKPKYQIHVAPLQSMHMVVHERYPKLPYCDYPAYIPVLPDVSSHKVVGDGVRKLLAGELRPATAPEDLAQSSDAVEAEGKTRSTNGTAQADTSRQLRLSTQRASAASLKGKENRESRNVPLVRPRKRSSDSDEMQEQKAKRRRFGVYEDDSISGARRVGRPSIAGGADAVSTRAPVLRQRVQVTAGGRRAFNRGSKGSSWYIVLTILQVLPSFDRVPYDVWSSFGYLVSRSSQLHYFLFFTIHFHGFSVLPNYTYFMFEDCWPSLHFHLAEAAISVEERAFERKSGMTERW